MPRTSAANDSSITISPARVLTAAEAAAIVYNVRDPTTEQVGKIVARINAGMIRRGPKGGMTTTTDAIAEYLSKRPVARPVPGDAKKGRAKQAATAPAAQPADRQEVNEAMSSCYQHFMRDYFRAVLFQRILGRSSTVPRSAVLATQVAALLLILGFAASVIQGSGMLPGTSPRDFRNTQPKER